MGEELEETYRLREAMSKLPPWRIVVVVALYLAIILTIMIVARHRFDVGIAR